MAKPSRTPAFWRPTVFKTISVRTATLTGAMQPDDTICHCFHVSMRKLVNFARRVKPTRPTKMSDCLNAGTGCGWCIPFLVKIAEDPDGNGLTDLEPDDYATQRSTYIKTQPKNTFENQEDSAPPA